MHYLAGSLPGGLAKPQWILTFSAFFHTIRLFGGTAGAVYMAHFLADREKLHSNLLGPARKQGNWITDANIHALAAGVLRKVLRNKGGGGPRSRSDRGPAASSGVYLSLIDGFLLVAWTCVIALLLVALLGKSPFNYADLSKLQPVKEKHS